MYVFAKRNFSEEKGFIPISENTNVEISVVKGNILITPTTRDSIFFYCIKSAGEKLFTDDIIVSVDTNSEKAVKIRCSWENINDDYRGDIEVLIPENVFLSRIFTASGNINLEDIKGDCSVECLKGNINIKGFNGRLSVYNMNGKTDIINSFKIKEVESLEGDINISLCENLPDSSNVKTSNGKITISIPQTASVEINLLAKSGKITIQNDLTQKESSSRENTKRVKLNDCKSKIFIENDEGNIEVKYSK